MISTSDIQEFLTSDIQEFLQQTPVPLLRGMSEEIAEGCFAIFLLSPAAYRLLIGAVDSRSFRPESVDNVNKALASMAGDADLVDLASEMLLRCRGRIDFAKPPARIFRFFKKVARNRSRDLARKLKREGVRDPWDLDQRQEADRRPARMIDEVEVARNRFTFMQLSTFPENMWEVLDIIVKAYETAGDGEEGALITAQQEIEKQTRRHVPNHTTIGVWALKYRRRMHAFYLALDEKGTKDDELLEEPGEPSERRKDAQAIRGLAATARVIRSQREPLWKALAWDMLFKAVIAGKQPDLTPEARRRVLDLSKRQGQNPDRAAATLEKFRDLLHRHRDELQAFLKELRTRQLHFYAAPAARLALLYGASPIQAADCLRPERDAEWRALTDALARLAV